MSTIVTSIVSIITAWWARFIDSTRTSRRKNGGWIPGFLQGLEWAMQSIPHSQTSLAELLELEKSKPALVVLRDDGSRAWFLPGIESPQAFFDYFGLTVFTPKGLGPLMKRLSRLLVMFQVVAWMTGSSVKVRYLRYGAARTQAYDGMIKASRQMFLDTARLRIERDYAPLIRIIGARLHNGTNYEPRISAEMERALRDEREELVIESAEVWRQARTMKEAEFTLLIGEDAGVDEAGFWKGHCSVVETNEYDLLLPLGGSKPEIKLSGDRVFFGVKPIAAHDHLFLDRQSLTNLNTPDVEGEMGFFSYDPDAAPGAEDRLVRWLREYLHNYKAKVDDGRFAETISEHGGHLRWESESKKFLTFYLHEFIARGGDVRWFRATLSQAYNLVIKKIQKRFKSTSYPIPGLRLYVRPASIGNRHVGRGQCAWDLQRGVVYINDVDLITFDKRFKNIAAVEAWLEKGHTIEELPLGVQKRLGGSDSDDAYNLVLFVDYDGKTKVLLWRSPNVPGEYIIMNYLSGAVPEGLGYGFKADSRRIKRFTKPEMDPEYAIKPFDTQTVGYSLNGVNRIARQIQRSRGAVGMFCLMTRLTVLICGDQMPAIACTAEEVIDACSKLFSDVSGVMQWTKDVAEQLTNDGWKVPQLVYEEFIKFLPEEWFDQGRYPDVLPDGAHWIDRLTAASAKVIEQFQAECAASSNLAKPPAVLFENAMGWASAGEAVRNAYQHSMYESNKLLKAIRTEQEWEDEDDEDSEPNPFAGLKQDEQNDLRYENARLASMAVLEQFPDEQWPMILAGGLAVTYMEHMAMRDPNPFEGFVEDTIKDSAFFQMGEKKLTGREPGIDRLMLDGLAAVGVIGDLKWTADRRLIVEMRVLTPLAAMHMARVQHGWFNHGINLGRVAENASMKSMNQSLVAELKSAFEGYDLKGKHLTPEMRKVQIGAKQVVKPVLVGQSGKMLGIISKVVSVDHLPKSVKVVTHHTHNDDTWLMLASD